MKITKKIATVTMIFGALAMAGCSDDNNPVNPQPETSRVLVVHASPDAPGVDLLVDNVKVNTQPLTFPNNTGYLSIASGDHNIKVNAAGTQTSVINADLNFGANMSYSVWATGSLADIQPLVLQDNLAAPAAGKAHVRFVHLSPDAPAVDITLTDGTVVFGNRAFRQYSDFTPLDAGSYDLQVRLAGTSTVVLELNDVQVQNGKIYSVFARGFVAGTGGQALGAQIVANN